MKVTIFGSSGLLGHALQKTENSHHNLYCPLSKEIDLRKKSEILKINNNDLWINAAAKVGGVVANTQEIGDFFKDNVDIGINVLNVAKDLKVKKVVSILSTCIYPDTGHVAYPLTEDQLHLGPPHKSNFGYAYAKRMLDVASRAYRQQWGCNFVTVVPNNLYGPHDNYDLNSSHVIPALIRKFFEAQRRKTDVVVWGTGRPLREFTFSEDVARIIWWASENYNEVDPINIGNTEEISIGDLAQLISKIISFQGKIKFDTSKPDGQHRKPTSNKKLLASGCNPAFTGLEEGLTRTIEHFVSKYPNVRGVEHNPVFII